MQKIITILFTLLLLSCDKDNSPAQPFDETLSQPFTDPRNGKQYKTAKTGNIVWMTENLDYETGDSLSWCIYGDCKKHGRVYNWEKAMNVCPSGWHLPSNEEWVILKKTMIPQPDGYCDDFARFDMSMFSKYFFAGWWTSTSAKNKGIYIYNPEKGKIYSPGDIDYDLDKLGCSVRCIKDNPYNNPPVLDSIGEANVDALLLAKYKTITNGCRIAEQDTYHYNSLCVKPAEITAYWLSSKAKQYERQFDKPVPECKQCTDLELLLMLEDAIEAETAKLDIVEKEENPALKAELKKAKADYEMKFRIRAPWWYMCSDREHLERLQKTIKTNKPELDYSYGLKNYVVGKHLASYERRFKKPAPNWSEKECSNKERWERLEKALKENKPYLTKEEEEKEKKNRYNFNFRYGDYPYYVFNFKFKNGDYPSDISVSKTATGAVAKFEMTANKRNSVALETNLSEEEWQNFANTIQRLGVTEWERIYRKTRQRWREWEVKILLPDGTEYNSSGYSVYPPDWEEFMKLMTGIKKRTSQELESRLQREYEKRFGRPMTERELSTEQVNFYFEMSNKTPIYSISQIIITRTATGAVAYYAVDRYRYGPEEGVKLSTEDWLDFINALYKSPFTNWEKEYGKAKSQTRSNDEYSLYIFSSNNFKPQGYFGYNKYPPGWDKFIKEINDIRAKAKKDSATVEVENKLKAGYKKRFGKPISDFELYAKSMKFDAFSSLLDKAIDINLDRTATGALIEYKFSRSEDGALLKAELSMEEWMDFLNNLQLCPAYKKTKLETRDMCCRKNLNNYAILDISYWSLTVESSGNTDVFETYNRDLCVPKWNEFMKIINSKKPERYLDSLLLR
ncbi:MAG: hypothetical protein LBQ76_00180 [Candidatus Fibromonas sp.]|jgi:hypothetical protein|nr:hypothetical protein [Candidatus Fibromonas sp.]